MAYEIVMPRLGWTMERGSLAEWHKKDGEFVQAGEILFSVEAEKAMQEVEAFESGILRIPPNSPAPGVDVPVGTILGYLVQPDESTPFDALGTAKTPAPVSPPTAPVPIPTPSRPVAEAESSPGVSNAISPRARRVALELGVDWKRLTGSGKDGRIEERDVRAAASERR